MRPQKTHLAHLAETKIKRVTGIGSQSKGLPHCHRWTYNGPNSVLRLYRSIAMRSSQIKPISYLKANAAEVLDLLAERREPMLITQNGEAKAVIQDIASYEETQETLALLKILALGNREVEEGRVRSLADAVRRLRARKTAA